MVLAIGIVCIGVGEVNLNNVKRVKIGQEYSVWSYALNLSEGRTYGVDISATDDWSLPFGRGDFVSPQPVNVTITSPGGGVTALRVFYYSERSTSPYYQVGIPAQIVGVTYENVDDAGLRMDTLSQQIHFTVRQSGPFNVSVVQKSVWSTEPPDYILFFEIVAQNRETYTFLATGGGIVGALGGATFIVGLFTSRKSKRKRARNQA
jgi:hypothetical protein